MILNYLKLSFRNIRKHKVFTVINVTGLAIGIAACLILVQYAFQQHSYDAYHTNTDRIYRLENEYYTDGIFKSESIEIPFKMTEAIGENIPQIEKMIRFDKLDYMNNTMISQSKDGTVSHNQSGVYITEKSLFETFDLPFVNGNFSRFDEPDKAIITEKIATKYFASTDPVGKKFSLSGNVGAHEYEVIGVMKNLPENTHFQWNVLLSFPSDKNYVGEVNNGSYHTYVLLKENTKKEEVISQLATISEQVYASTFARTNGSMKYEMHALEKIQLHYPQFNGFKEAGDLKTVNILIVVAVIILLIAWFNYINLSTVKAIERAKEIGIRKVLGSRKKHILYQFITESVLINLIAALIAFTIVQISVPLMASYLEFPVTFSLDPVFWLLILVTLLTGALLSALYPASIMMGFSPLSILSKKITLNKGGVGFRKILVVTQFVISVILIAATLTVYKQVKFMTSADLGMNIDNVVVIKSPPGNLNDGNGFFEAVGTFKNELENNSLISVMTTSSAVPGKELSWGTSAKQKGQPDSETKAIMLIAVGENFDKAYSLELIAGRLIEKGDNPWGNGNVVINEKAVQELGFDNPEAAIGGRIEANVTRGDLIIRGVVGNHNHTSLKQNYDPVIYMASVWSNFYTVKLAVNESLPAEEQLKQVNAGTSVIKKEWETVFPYATLDYFFLDQEFDKLYKKDRQFGLIFGLFSGLAIIIASLGLLGLSSFSIARRTKEIGVRKVLGASDAQVVRLLSKEYIILIVIANVVAVPLAWYFLSAWLENYHFRISLGWWMAIVPLVIVLSIALATISIKVFRVASGNPVDSLRYE